MRCWRRGPTWAGAGTKQERWVSENAAAGRPTPGLRWRPGPTFAELGAAGRAGLLGLTRRTGAAAASGLGADRENPPRQGQDRERREPGRPCLAAAALLLTAGCPSDGEPSGRDAAPPPPPPPRSSSLLRAARGADPPPAKGASVKGAADAVARDWTVPWGLAPVPGGDLLASSRDDATHHHASDEKNGDTTELGAVPGVSARAGRLLGIALSPTTARTNMILTRAGLRTASSRRFAFGVRQDTGDELKRDRAGRQLRLADAEGPRAGGSGFRDPLPSGAPTRPPPAHRVRGGSGTEASAEAAVVPGGRCTAGCGRSGHRRAATSCGSSPANTDGRGDAKADDDRILEVARVRPSGRLSPPPRRRTPRLPRGAAGGRPPVPEPRSIGPPARDRPFADVLAASAPGVLLRPRCAVRPGGEAVRRYALNTVASVVRVPYRRRPQAVNADVGRSARNSASRWASAAPRPGKETPSFARMLENVHAGRLGEMNSSPAILAVWCGRPRPWAQHVSRSRRVSPAPPPRPRGGCGGAEGRG
ncbi:hypothetical protein FQR65_LT20172 [Abscondita terminalis]|nr:hypothetical protein FQR65_LT20172 [Abscondita terminalis]